MSPLMGAIDPPQPAPSSSLPFAHLCIYIHVCACVHFGMRAISASVEKCYRHLPLPSHAAIGGIDGTPVLTTGSGMLINYDGKWQVTRFFGGFEGGGDSSLIKRTIDLSPPSDKWDGSVQYQVGFPQSGTTENSKYCGHWLLLFADALPSLFNTSWFNTSFLSNPVERRRNHYKVSFKVELACAVLSNDWFLLSLIQFFLLYFFEYFKVELAYVEWLIPAVACLFTDRLSLREDIWQNNRRSLRFPILSLPT